MTTAGNTNVVATAGMLGYHKSPSEASDGLDFPQWVASIVKEEWNNEVIDVELMRDAPNIGDELLNTLKWLCIVSIPHQLLGQKLRKYYRNWRR
ncbi:hypothetical protein BC332_14861 [Capsicum chinense]|nr:hypothetical protein BC332_14861 [Capsicum chinense]